MLTHNGSLRTRLALVLGLVLLCGGALLLLLARTFAGQAADEVYDKLLESAALTAMESLTVREQQLSFDLPYASLATLSLAPDDRVVYSLIDDIDHTNRVLTGYDNTPWPLATVMLEKHQQNEPYFYSADYQQESFRFVVLERELLESGVQGKVWLQMGQSQLARQELSADLTLKALLGIIGLVLLGGVFVWLAAGRSLRPLLAVEAELLQRKPTELKPLVTRVPQEIAHLVEAINRFMGRLQRNQDRNHAFIAEAAHQLRTPLASLQAQAELASEATAAEEFRGRSQRILRNAQETNSRINQLLSYATLAHRADVLIPESVQLADVVTQCLGDMVSLALREQVELSFDNQAGDVSLTADPEAICELVRNLVDNALKYGQQGAAKKAVHVSLFWAEETAITDAKTFPQMQAQGTSRGQPPATKYCLSGSEFTPVGRSGACVSPCGLWLPPDGSVPTAIKDTTKKGQQLILQVRDYGPGLPTELLKAVTRRFGRGEFRQRIGSGLGLAIVEQLVHAMDGKLELENGVQGGLKARLIFWVEHH